MLALLFPLLALPLYIFGVYLPSLPFPFPMFPLLSFLPLNLQGYPLLKSSKDSTIAMAEAKSRRIRHCILSFTQFWSSLIKSKVSSSLTVGTSSNNYENYFTYPRMPMRWVRCPNLAQTLTSTFLEYNCPLTSFFKSSQSRWCRYHDPCHLPPYRNRVDEERGRRLDPLLVFNNTHKIKVLSKTPLEVVKFSSNHWPTI